MEEPGGLQESMGSQRVRHDWETSLSFFLNLAESTFSQLEIIAEVTSQGKNHCMHLWLSETLHETRLLPWVTAFRNPWKQFLESPFNQYSVPTSASSTLSLSFISLFKILQSVTIPFKIKFQLLNMTYNVLHCPVSIWQFSLICDHKDTYSKGAIQNCSHFNGHSRLSFIHVPLL